MVADEGGDQLDGLLDGLRLDNPDHPAQLIQHGPRVHARIIRVGEVVVVHAVATAVVERMRVVHHAVRLHQQRAPREHRPACRAVHLVAAVAALDGHGALGARLGFRQQHSDVGKDLGVAGVLGSEDLAALWADGLVANAAPVVRQEDEAAAAVGGHGHKGGVGCETRSGVSADGPAFSAVTAAATARSV